MILSLHGEIRLITRKFRLEKEDLKSQEMATHNVSSAPLHRRSESLGGQQVIWGQGFANIARRKEGSREYCALHRKRAGRKEWVSWKAESP